ncbi:MAG: ORF6N domain-containing protein [Verrucomicrobiota bacterium]
MNPNPPLETIIFSLRHQKVILDADLAGLYGVPTRALNQAIKRNADRFPADFMFQLTVEEWRNLKSQIVTSSFGLSDEAAGESANPTAAGHGGRRKRPYAFTEHGALMAANVLNSADAVKMSVYVVRAFIKQREMMLAHADVLKRLAQLDAGLIEHDEALRVIWRELQPLLSPPPVEPKRQIGFRP